MFLQQICCILETENALLVLKTPRHTPFKCRNGSTKLTTACTVFFPPFFWKPYKVGMLHAEQHLQQKHITGTSESFTVDLSGLC